MMRRYNCLKLTLITAALIVGMKPTSASAQPTGACCIEDLIDEAAAKLISYSCLTVTPAICTSVSGEYQGDGTQCAGVGPFASLEECRGQVLPVELTAFDALVNGDQVLLAWSTASELNNAGFSVEQEVGSDVFSEIGYVEGHGTSIEPKEYSFAVNDLDPGLHRFRLKQIDFDGAFEYSSVVEAAVTVPDRFLIEPAYPNPFNPTTTLRFAVGAEQHVEVTLVNAAGQSIRTLYSGTVVANEMKQLVVDAVGLPSGTYLVHFEGNGLSATERIVLLR